MPKARKRRPQKIWDRSRDACIVSREVDKRLCVFQALWNLPRQKRVFVDVDCLERGQAGEEIGWNGGESVAVEEDDLEVREAAEGGETAGEAVVLQLQPAEPGEISEHVRNRSAESVVPDLDAGDPIRRLAPDSVPFAGIWVRPVEGFGAIDALGESLHCRYISSICCRLCKRDERAEIHNCNEKDCNFHLGNGSRRD